MSNAVYGDAVWFRNHGGYATGTVHSGAELFRMDDPAEYREFAAQCERFAAEAQTEQHRKFLMEMAERWRRLAAEINQQD